MNNLFLNNVAEVKLSYITNVPAKDRPTISCSRDAERIFRECFEGTIEHVESFHILILSRSNKVLGHKRISEGGINGTVVDVRLILQTAILGNASVIILGHNHPSGNLKPSQADIRTTKKVVEAGKIMDIAVLDHIIVSLDSYYSFADENEI